MLKTNKIEYVNFKKLYKEYPGAKYYIIYGERSNGKTSSALEFALENYKRDKEQFVYVRRFGEDIKKKYMSRLFGSLIERKVISRIFKKEFNSINFYNSVFYLENVDNNIINEEKEAIGCVLDLNSVDHSKSISFPKVSTIIFDEFISRVGYLTNEFVLFMNIISTVVRERDDITIIMLGNTVNQYCPYFKEMGLKHVRNQKPGDIDVYEYNPHKLKVIVYYSDSAMKGGGKPSDVYFAFDNPQLKMITGGSWEIGMYPRINVKIRPKDIVTNFFVCFNEDIIHGRVISTNEDTFLFFHSKNTPIKDTETDIVYTDTPIEKWNYKIGIHNQVDRLSSLIMRFIESNKVFYSDNETGEILRNYMDWSFKYNSTTN